MLTPFPSKLPWYHVIWFYPLVVVGLITVTLIRIIGGAIEWLKRKCP